MGVWIETMFASYKKSISLSHPVWVCGLKHLDKAIGYSDKASHPVWVCGLKLKMLDKIDQTLSHTLYGCVDWNFIDGKLANRLIRHTLYGCVDWNKKKPQKTKLFCCHTLYGCVDWNFIQT